MFATVVILTRNRLKQLERCLRSLRGQRPADFEVVVVDTGSTDGTPDWLRRESPIANMRVIEARVGSFASARNEGVEEANGDWVAFLDDDCTAAPDWLFRMSTEAPVRDAIGGLALPARPMPLPAWWHPDMGWMVGWAVRAQLRRSTGCRFYPSTSNMAIRRVLLQRHRFQEIQADFGDSENVYQGGREDAELWRRLRRIGYRTLFLPEMIVYHDVPPGRFNWRYMLNRARADGQAFWEREHPNEILEDVCREVAQYYLTWLRRLFDGRSNRAVSRLWIARQLSLLNAAVGNLPAGEKIKALAGALGKAGRQVVVNESKRIARPWAVRRENRRRPRLPLPDIPRCLAVAAFGYLGDMVLIEPACRAFRNVHPKTRMVLLTHPMGEMVHHQNGLWDRCVVFRGGAGESPTHLDLEGIRNELAGLKVDAVAVPYCHETPPEAIYHTTKAGVLTFDCDVGFPRRMWYDLASERIPKNLERQEIINIAKLFERWGPLATLEPYRWNISEEERSEARLLLKRDERVRRHTIALHIGSARPYKQWPLRHWTSLVALLGQVQNLDLVFVGDERCVEAASEVIRANRLSAINLCGRLSVRLLAAVLKEVSVLVSGDSGPCHVAFAVGTPTVVLYGHSEPERWGAYWEREKHIALRGGNPDLTPEEAHGLPVDYLMSRISPDHVYEAVRAQFARNATKR